MADKIFLIVFLQAEELHLSVSVANAPFPPLILLPSTQKMLLMQPFPSPFLP